MRRNRHAKIVATVGPASASPEMLKALFLAGVDVSRLNFSHGTQDDHAAVHGSIRRLEREMGRPIGILQDLQGPKIRIGTPIAAAAADLARVTKAAAIVAFTSSGTTAARIARRRPEVPILTVTPDERVSRQLCLLWGAHSVRSDDVASSDEINQMAEMHALAEGFAKPNDLIIVVSGAPFGQAGTTNNLRVLQLNASAGA